MNWARVFETNRRMLQLQRRWTADKETPARWQLIRDAYSLQLPSILEHPCDPYFLDWDFTPIEQLAWQDIRGLGLSLYPQFPALQYFIDFADPVLQIGVELDGKAYHDAERDRVRDELLWEQGWRIFRIPGRESLPAPTDPRFDRDGIPFGDVDALNRAFYEWGSRWSTGFFWALKAFYYGGRLAQEDLRLAAFAILDEHRLVNFDLSLDDDDEDEY